ncbi:D-alanyl-D-alanine carboxypeptidase/D-alanyl-D-alanine-endopeptidase [Saccharicrinis sp. FJH54]|uniref:D-alanyl-D-alanine carboxypeptidase/D-alanyl-D-alanine endopeptidase n=1 Tax=Saccharicrinis sp. FJH54 TaxID=3344665 RepID=UPI0035D521F1
MRKSGILIIILIFLAFKCHAQFQDEDYQHASVGISVVDVSGNKSVQSLNPDKSLVPASTLKLLTTATVLKKLGAAYRFKTELLANGSVSDGILNGSLIVKGSGDPTLGSRYFNPDIYSFIDDWITALKARGIKGIEGDLVADISGFYPEPVPSRWIWEDIGNYYGAGVYPLTCFDNYYTLSFYPAKVGAKARIATVDPEIKGLSFTVEAVGSPVNKDSAYIFGGPFEMHKRVRGSIPANRMDFSIKGAIPNPPEVLLDALKGKLIESGIKVKGELILSDVPVPADLKITETISPELSEIAAIVNYHSNNLFAEHLFRAVQPDKDIQSIVKEIKQYWESMGIDMSPCFLYDGSGLSPSDALSPKLMTDILCLMAKDADAGDGFMKTIPQAGKEGSVRSFLQNTTDAVVLAKSGSMDNTRCYAGYIKKGGKTFAFSIMVNKFTCSQKKVVQDIESWLSQTIQTL